MSEQVTVIYKIAPEEVVVNEGRIRRKFEEGSLVSLGLSIKHMGQLQPGVCTKGEEGKVLLIAGERRLRACADVGVPFRFVLYEDITDPLRLKEIELEENIMREDLHWREDVDAKAELHALKQELYGKPTPGTPSSGWRMDDTASSLRESRGLVSQDVELSLWASQIPEVGNAKTKTEAKKIIKRLKQSLSRSDALKEALEKDREEKAVVLEDGGGDAPVESVPETGTADVGAQVAYYNKRVVHGTFEEEAENIASSSIDIVIFDPPWAVDFDKVRLATGTTKGYSDDVEENLKLFPRWLEILYDKMAANSHLYLFFGIRNFEIVHNTLEAVGFSTNRMPLFWHKQGAHRTRNPKVWPGRCYEPIAFARKGSKDLVQQGRPDIISTPVPTPTMKQDHPSAKHPALLLDLLLRSGEPGDKILDPMCGSGMVGVAAEHLRATKAFDWLMIEKEQTFRELAMYNLIRGYNEIVHVKSEKEQKDEVRLEAHQKYDKIADDLKEKRDAKMEGKSFSDLTPGTPEWKEYWREHPEEQNDMLAWAKARKS
jgi:DNA modification methylase